MKFLPVIIIYDVIKCRTGQPVYISGSARQVSPPSGALLVTFQNVPCKYLIDVCICSCLFD